MYKYFMSFCTVLFFCGCASTQSTITEFDHKGNVVKKTETSESVIRTVMSSTKNKSVIIWEDGWAAYISASTGTADEPTPHGKIFCGKINKGWISIQYNQKNITDIAKIIQATKNDVALSFEGVKSTSSDMNPDSK